MLSAWLGFELMRFGFPDLPKWGTDALLILPSGLFIIITTSEFHHLAKLKTGTFELIPFASLSLSLPS